MEHNFKEGQEVICISKDFPLIERSGGNGQKVKTTPKLNEVLVIDEILGNFLRFDKYDMNESYNWWHVSKFAHIDDVNESISSLEVCVNNRDPHTHNTSNKKCQRCNGELIVNWSGIKCNNCDWWFCY